MSNEIPLPEQDNSISTYEQVKLCPKCGRSGDVRRKTPAPGLPRGTIIHHIYCVTPLCTWFSTPWLVQVNPDNTIPAPSNHLFDKKIYEGFEGHDEKAANLMEQLKIAEQIRKNGQFDDVSGIDSENPFGTR